MWTKITATLLTAIANRDRFADTGGIGFGAVVTTPLLPLFPTRCTTSDAVRARMITRLVRLMVVRKYPQILLPQERPIFGSAVFLKSAKRTRRVRR